MFYLFKNSEERSYPDHRAYIRRLAVRDRRQTMVLCSQSTVAGIYKVPVLANAPFPSIRLQTCVPFARGLISGASRRRNRDENSQIKSGANHEI